MCAIVGMSSKRAGPQVSQMLRRVSYRGPDSSNIATNDTWTLGHARLSILDVAKGNQPMYDKASNAHIVHNGEIYNFRKLRDGLSGKFKTDSDTEVILRLHATHDRPEDWLPRLDGMFAFAIVDERGLLVARDPLGIKPLYLGVKNDTVVFGSEIKAVLAVTDKVVEFPPGHVYTQTDGERPFRELTPCPDRCYDPAVIAEELRQRVTRSVQSRLIADVPLGVFLSGGLDSSIVAAVARQTMPGLKTFAVGMEGSTDLEAARCVAEYLDTDHYERVFSIEEATQALRKVIYHLESFDAALVRSAIPNYFLAQLASQHVKVALSGEGADELFAGYSYLRGMHGVRLERELSEITSELHFTNLQRCDRMSMAHGLEVRVPFLGDVDLVEYAMSIPVQFKLEPKKNIEKWILRKAFEDILPREIVWRKKLKFAHGTGIGGQLAEHAERKLQDSRLERALRRFPQLEIRDKEELLYFSLFRELFPVECLASLIGRSRSL